MRYRASHPDRGCRRGILAAAWLATILPSLVSTVWAAEPAASVPQSGASRARSGDRLRQADRDGDGFLSREEVERYLPRLAVRFAQIDMDGDGRLSPREIRGDARSRRKPNQQSREGTSITSRFAQADRDGDGRLSPDEALTALPRVAAKFARIDVDGDGLLSEAELNAWIAHRKNLRSSRS